MTPIDVAAGEIVTKEGDQGDRLYVTETGLYTVSQNGEVIGNQMGPFQVIMAPQLRALTWSPRSIVIDKPYPSVTAGPRGNGNPVQVLSNCDYHRCQRRTTVVHRAGSFSHGSVSGATGTGRGKTGVSQISGSLSRPGTVDAKRKKKRKGSHPEVT